MAKIDSRAKKFNFRETMLGELKELAEEKGLSETQVMENAFALYKKKEDSDKAEKFVMDKFSGLETHLSDVEKRFDGLEQKVEKTVTHIDLLLSTISSSLQLLTTNGE
jgi:vacuolar-type H+-ATPase subunit I/STV1